MSSHREAPAISKDPVADSTDVYAFRSPDRPETITLIANYVPLQTPQGGPNFYQFGDDVLYEIVVSNKGKATADIVYQFQFTTHVMDPNTFLYNTGPIDSLESPNFNYRQTFNVTKVENGKSKLIGLNLKTPPFNIGPLSTPNYPKLADEAHHTLTDGTKCFVGQRAEGFYVDLGAVFDLLTLRPFQGLNKYEPMHKAAGVGVDGTQGLNVNTIALQVPTHLLTRHGATPDRTDAADAASVIGVYTTASRRATRVIDTKTGETVGTGPYRQVSRLANPLVNEVLIPLGKKDFWNSRAPEGDSAFFEYFNKPGICDDIVALYPTAFPNLARQVKHNNARPDLVAILLTGIPSGVVPGFQNNTGTVQSDMVRLNVAFPPLKPGDKGYSNLGVLGGDVSGFPNGRRVADDVVTIELRALAGLTLPLVNKVYKADAAAAAVTDGATYTNKGAYTDTFPYLGTPSGGEESGTGTPATS